MVEEVMAFRASDGKVFDDRLEALEHEVIRALTKMEVFNVASATAIAKNAVMISSVLAPLAAEIVLRDSAKSAPEHLAQEPQSETSID